MQPFRKFLAIDQYGQTVRFNAKRPRAGLLEELHATHATKIYRDRSNHVGYKVGSRWFNVYELTAPDEFKSFA